MPRNDQISVREQHSVSKCHRFSHSTANEDSIEFGDSYINNIQSKQRFCIRITLDIPSIDEPSNNDVLCSQSKTARCHFGNTLFYRLVDANLAIFRNCTSAHKLLLAQSIVDALDTRFLRKERGGGWYDIGRKAAIQYTLITLENLRKEKDLRSN
jgi:hypothetical protein